jgi:hypothetical protein
MTDEQFFERLRNDAAPLRYEPDSFAVARIRERIRERIEARPTVAQLLANWFRPLTAALTAIAIAAVIAVAAIDTGDNTIDEPGVEIVMAGDSYSVGQ